MKKRELLKMIRELSERVYRLDLEVAKLQVNRVFGGESIQYLPSVWKYTPSPCPLSSSGAPCEYPASWHATTPAPCIRCGQGAVVTTASIATSNGHDSITGWITCNKCDDKMGCTCDL
jgi:hypothetical protein